jgi:predicted signal transduction protein with EAL and GGDEF domain
MLTVAATSGIAIPPDPYCYDPEELFAHADATLYAAKRRLRRGRASDRR